MTCLIEELDHREQKSNQHAQKVGLLRVSVTFSDSDHSALSLQVALIHAELVTLSREANFASLLCQVWKRLRLTTNGICLWSML